MASQAKACIGRPPTAAGRRELNQSPVELNLHRPPARAADLFGWSAKSPWRRARLAAPKAPTRHAPSTGSHWEPITPANRRARFRPRLPSVFGGSVVAKPCVRPRPRLVEATATERSRAEYPSHDTRLAVVAKPSCKRTGVSDDCCWETGARSHASAT